MSDANGTTRAGAAGAVEALRGRLGAPVGHRMLSGWLAAPFRRRNYETLARLLHVAHHPVPVLARYVAGGGHYPFAAELRTPIGDRRAALFHAHDVVTLAEIFFREDYRAPRDLRVAIDVGANIGLSGLYFLTRNDRARCYLYEPLRENVAKLDANLAGLDGRYEVAEAAVGPASGRVEFAIEETGRYGSIGGDTGKSIEVECRGINDVLAEVLEREERVDVLKLDTEGLEAATIAAIESRLLERVDMIYFEATVRPPPLHPQHFVQSRRGHVELLTAR